MQVIKDKGLFPIVPLFNYSKIPKISWSNEEVQIKSVDELGKYKNVTGYSLICGKRSNTMVIDIDLNHGDGSINGIENFQELISEFSEQDKKQILSTMTVQTPRGGKHLYFKYKEGLKSKANYIDGIDVKTDGGLIVLPGTRVRIDNKVKTYELIQDNPIQEMPQVLFDKLINLIKPVVTKKSNIVTTNNNSAPSQYNEGSRNQELFKEVISIISKSSIREVNTISSIAKGLNLLKCNPPLDSKEVDNIVGSIVQRLNPSYCDEKGNIDNWSLVQEVLKERPSYVKGNLWFIYDDEKGYYDHKELKEVQRMYFNYAVKNKDKTPTRSKNFAELLMLNAEDAKSVYDEKKYINCLNGVIDINTNELMEHDPKYKLQVQFKANYIEDWKSKYESSKFKRFLETTLDKDDILTMQQAFGLFLSPHAREAEKVFLLKGSGSNGKSVMFDIMESLIDKKYISGVGLGDFGQEFIISMMEGKHANIVRDDDFERTIHKHFKSIATGEEVAVNRKNKDHVRLAFNVTMFFGLNGLPNSKDKSYGFFRRPIIIQFDNTFGTQREVDEGKAMYLKDPTISKEIIEHELDIVFSWAYDGLQTVKSNNWTVEQSQKSIDEMEQYREETDTVYAFYKTCITEMLNNNIYANKLYEEYITFCSRNYIEKPVSSTTFGRQMKSFGIKKGRDNKAVYYVNITTDLERVYVETNIFDD